MGSANYRHNPGRLCGRRSGASGAAWCKQDLTNLSRSTSRVVPARREIILFHELFSSMLCASVKAGRQTGWVCDEGLRVTATTILEAWCCTCMHAFGADGPVNE
jgi:hypothetical protein